MRTALVIILLLAILARAVFVGHYGWVSAGDVAMPAWGWLMLGLRIFFTLLVGFGLMALVFYSSRAGFDEPPEVVQKEASSNQVDEDDTGAQNTALVLAMQSPTISPVDLAHALPNDRFVPEADVLPNF